MILYYILVPLAWLVFHIGFRVRCEGRENLKKIGTKGCIIAPNHISAIDPVFVVITRFWGQRMTVFAKKELFEINPFLSWFFRCAGAVCVRGTKEEVSVIEDTVKKCQEGGTLLLFPEGTPQERPLRHRGGSKCGRRALPHLLRHPRWEDEAVLQGACHLRRAHARCTVCNGRPP